jgi:hypothetical protein
MKQKGTKHCSHYEWGNFLHAVSFSWDWETLQGSIIKDITHLLLIYSGRNRSHLYYFVSTNYIIRVCFWQLIVIKTRLHPENTYSCINLLLKNNILLWNTIADSYILGQQIKDNNYIPLIFHFLKGVKLYLYSFIIS